MEFDDPRVADLRRREIERNIPLVVVVAIVLVLGIIGNLFSIVFYGFSKKRTVTNFLIAALALNDLLANFIFWDEIVIIFQSFTFTDKTGCKTVYFLNNWILINSVILLAVIAIDRYRRICHPFSKQISSRAACFIVLGVTMVTFCLTLRETFLADIVAKPVKMNDNSTVYGYFCVHTDDKTYTSLIQVSHLLNIVLFLTSIILMIVLYVLVIRKIVTTRLSMTHSTVFSKDLTSSSAQTEDTGVSEAEKNCVPTKNGQTNATNDDDSLIPQNGKTSNDNRPKTHILITDATSSASDPQTNNGHARKENGYTPCNKKINTKGSVTLQHSKAANEAEDEKAKKNNKAERGVTTMVIAFTAVSILSFVPYFGTMIFAGRHVSTEDNLSNMGKKVARQFYMLNCVVNPYIMCYFNTRFRRFISSFVCRRTCQLSSE